MRRTEAAAALAAVVLAFVALGVGLLILSARTSWRAEARGALEVVEVREPEWVTAYKEDLLTRETILPTYGTIVGDERFQREAARRLGLGGDERPSIAVGVEALPTQSLITVTATATSPEVASSMATEVLRRASVYIDSLGRPYELNLVEGFDTAAAPRNDLSLLNAGLLALGCALGGLALYRLLTWVGNARAWLARTA